MKKFLTLLPSSYLFLILLATAFFASVYHVFALSYIQPGLTLDPGVDYPGTCVDPINDCTTEVLRIGNPVGDATDGSLLFVDSSGELAEDNTSLFWDTATTRLGIGTNTPGYRLDIESSGSIPASVGAPVEVGLGTLDDLSVGGTYIGSNDDVINVYIDSTGTPDTFGWYDDNGDFAGDSGVPITGGAQTLTGTGVTVTFDNTTLHGGTEFWTINVAIATTGPVGDINFGGSVYKAGQLWSGAIGGVVDNALDGIIPYVNSSGELSQDASFGYGEEFNTLFVGNISFVSESADYGLINFGTERLHSYGTSNEFWGADAGNFTVTGTNNIGLGTNAARALTTGTGNVCIGQQTCQNVTIGQNNIMMGKKTGENHVSGNNNILIGFDLDSQFGSTSSDTLNLGNTIYGNLSTGSIGIGDSAVTSKFSVGSGGLFRVNSTGLALAPVGAAGTPAWSFVSDPDTGIFQNGTNVLGLSTGGTTRVTVNSSGLGVGVTPDQSLDISGNFELPLTTSGGTAGVIMRNGSRMFHTYGNGLDGNIFLGLNAGNFTTNGGGIGIGANALQALTDGTENIVLGTGGGSTITSGNSNTLIGSSVMEGLTTGSSNTAVGAFAGRVAFGSNNIFVGTSLMNAPDPFLTNNNIIIGNRYDLETIALPQTSDLFIIDPDIDGGGYPFIYGEFDNNILVFNASSVGIGDMSPDNTFDVEQATDGIVATFADDDNSCTVDPDTGVTCTSDRRLKTNIETMESALSDVRLLNPVRYGLVSDPNEPHIGFIAQEVMDLYPELVNRTDKGYYALNYAGLTPILTKAIQELDMNVTALSSLDTSDDNSLGSLIVSFLADSANSIGEIFTRILHADRVETDELCVGSVCVTEEEFMSVFSDSHSGSGGGGENIEEGEDLSSDGTPEEEQDNDTEEGDTGDDEESPHDLPLPEPEGDIEDASPELDAPTVDPVL